MTDFASHLEIGPREYVETIGIEFDAIHKGLIIEHRPGFTLYLRDAIERARISGDHTPAVTDPDVAAACGGGSAEILQTWLVGSLASLTTRAFGRVTANLGWYNVVFETPAQDGDTMFAETEVLDKRRSNSRPNQGILHILTRGITRRQMEVCRFERKLLVYQGPQGPHKQAGYA